MALVALLGVLSLAPAAQASNCYVATSQGSTGPTSWQTYCWIDFSTYNDTTARSASGQNFSLTLQDGTVMTFTMKVNTPGPLAAVAAPSWSGAAVGNTAFLGIAGQPVLYQTVAGTSTVTFSNILLTPPSGGSGVTAYMFIGADGESTNNGESLSFQTNGGNWQMLDQAGPISGSTYPTISGTGTTTFTETGAAGTVGAYIVGSSTPTTVTTTLVGGGLQGAMFAVRFASIRLNLTIGGARVNAADQFNFTIAATSNGTSLASGASSGTSLGPYTAASLSSTAAIPLTLTDAMASGSVSTLSHYKSVLTCTNANPSSTVMPSGVVTNSYSFGAMQFGDNVQCNYLATPYPHLTLQKALGATGRQYSTDQFTLNIANGGTTVATTTTAGTGTTLTSAATAQTQVTAGTTYSLAEVASGTTTLAQYTAAMGCTNANTTSSTALPAAPGGSITPALGDVVSCTITNTKLASNANLSVTKTSTLVSDPVNGASNPKSIPGAIVLYRLTVANTGPSPVDNNTVVLIDALPSQLSVGTAASPTFIQGTPSSGLTFAAADIAFSSSASAPTSFAACTYTPVSAYDPAVKFVCLNPKGTMAGSTGTSPSFAITLQAKIN